MAVMIDWGIDPTDGPNGSGGVGIGTGGPGGVSTADARDIEFGRLMILLSEGEIQGLVNGLKSIYLNDTPIQNDDDSFNFKGVAVAMTAGTNTQAPIPGFPAVESEVSVNTEVSVAGGAVTRSIATSGLTAVRVRIAVPALKVINQTTGKEEGTSVQVKIERQRTGYNGGAYEEVDLDQTGTIRGKFGAKHTKSFRIELPDTGTGAWNIRVTRLTADAPDAYTINETWWDSYTEITDGKFRYPNSACLAVMVDAKQFPSVPQVSADVDLKLVQVPANYTPATQDPDTGVWTAATYATTGPGTTGGLWDGTFTTAFTRNPVWQFYDLATSTRYGAGTYLDASQLDSYTLYAISEICDEMVDDGAGGTEPRYFCDVHIQGQEDAQTVLGHFAAAFRGMAYWAGGKLTAAQDKDEDPVMLFTAANVEHGKFTYEGMGRKARHTAAVVAYNDPNTGYRQEHKYVEDENAVARYGLNIARMQAFGATSQGLAIRFGRWKVFTDLLSYETVNFVTGAQGGLLQAGQVIQIQDPHRAGLSRAGGRVGSGSTTTSIVLDSSVTLPGGTNYLKCQLPDGTVETKTISTGAGTHSTLAVASAFSDVPEGIWIVQEGATAYKYRVVGIRDLGEMKYAITALFHDQDKYTAIETGVSVVDPEGPPTPSFPPVGSLAANETLRKQNDKIITVLTATWLPPTLSAGAAQPASYIAEAQREDGPWVPMTISASSAELQDVDLGDWTVRVSAVYPGGISTPATDTHTVLGKTAPPEDVTTFVAAVNGDVLAATWDAVSDVDLSHYIIKVPGAGATDAIKWAAGTAVTGCEAISVTFATLARPATGSYDYWIKAVDTSGNESANPTKLTIEVNPLDDYVTPTEKRSSQAEYDRLWGEKSTLDARADAASVSRTAYDNALTALDTYLDTLTGAQGWTPVAAGTGHWALYTESYYLGTVGSTGAIFYSKFKDVWTARDALTASILQAGLASNAATDTFRPRMTWDFTATNPGGFTAGSITTAACSAPDDKTARKWTTTTSGLLGKFTTQPDGNAFSYAGTECYIVQARVKLVSGNWTGKCYYSTDGTTFTQNVTISAPTTGAWQIVTWDLRGAGTSITSQSVIKGFALELAGSGTTEIHVDYVTVGIYGHGSALDYDLALQGAITDLLARANTTTFANLVVGNTTNLFPNPNSEILPVAAGGALPDASIGAVGIPASYTANQYAGLRCREITSTTAVTVTPRIHATAGDVYYFEAQMACSTPGTPTVTLRPYDASGGALTTQTLTGSTTSYAKASTQFTLPASTYSFDLAFHNAGGSGSSIAFFDNIVLRKAADGQLLVPGTIQAKHIIAGAIQSYQMSIGPWLQFRANAGGLALQGRADGSLTRATSAELTGPPALPAENADDPCVYMDDSRSYPAADVKTFEAQWGGTTEDRGILLNLGSAFATSGQTGLLVHWSGTTLKVCGCTGIGKYPTNTTKTAVTNGTATVSTTSSADDKLTVIYYSSLVPPVTGGTATIRMRVLINGAIVLSLTDTDLGSYGGASQAGYAGVFLGGNVRMFMPRFGRGFVTIQDGVVTADKIAAEAIIAEKLAATLVLTQTLKSNNPSYTAGTSVAAPVGFRISGNQFTTTFLGGGTATDCVAEFGGSVNINGYEAATVTDATIRASYVIGMAGTGASDKAWYRGNCDETVNDGAPDIGCLTVTRRRWDTTNKIARLEMKVQPTAANDNLDGMRYAKIQLIRQGALGTGQSRTDIDTYYLPLTDRSFYSTTDSDAGNAIMATFETNDSAVSSGYPGAIITLYNLYGPSATHCFYSNTGNGDSDGTTLLSNGTTNAWSSGSGGGSGGGGSGGGGGFCVTPDTLILTASGEIPAGTVRPGHLVYTQPEGRDTWDWFPVVAAKLAPATACWRLEAEGGLVLQASTGHRLRTREGWTEIETLETGREVRTQSGWAKVLDVQPAPDSEVVQLTVEMAHTYLSGGILSHNIKFVP